MSARRAAGQVRKTGRPRGVGQALVEFALVAPLFFVLLFAIIDFGRYVYYVQILNNAAREGARYAIVHGSDSLAPTGPPSADATGNAVKAVVRNYAIGVIANTTALDVDVSWQDPVNPLATPSNSRGNTVTVIATYQFNSLIPMVPIPALEIEGASTLVINH